MVGCHSAEHHFVARHSDANATMPQVSYSAVKKMSKRETKMKNPFFSSFSKLKKKNLLKKNSISSRLDLYHKAAYKYQFLIVIS